MKNLHTSKKSQNRMVISKWAHKFPSFSHAVCAVSVKHQATNQTYPNIPSQHKSFFAQIAYIDWSVKVQSDGALYGNFFSASHASFMVILNVVVVVVKR